MRLREFAVPLQAFLAVTICFSLIWMVYAMAFFDPTPPTAAEIKSLATNDPEISGLKTAAALTVNALFAFGPTQILLPTSTPTFTLTFTPTITATGTSISTRTATATYTLIPFTATPTGGDSPFNPVPTKTPIPTLTSTSIPTVKVTLTSIPPFTLTPVPTIATEPPPTATNEPPPTNTPAPPPTDPPPTDLPPPTPVVP